MALHNPALIRHASKAHAFLYRLFGGAGATGHYGRAPILLLMTTGRKTGKRRTAPLIYQRDGDAGGHRFVDDRVRNKRDDRDDEDGGNDRIADRAIRTGKIRPATAKATYMARPPPYGTARVWMSRELRGWAMKSSRRARMMVIGVSLGVFVLLYIVLGVVDFVLMRRYARLDPPPLREEAGPAVPAPVY